jgi:hypothetical protein
MGGAEQTLRIKVLRGGTVTEIATFLTDLEGAYNALYAFEWTISHWQRRRRFFPPFFPDEFFGLLPSDQDARDVLPEYRLELKRVSIQSPGWLEVLGALNPLREIREYLKDRHERRKDHEYREPAEKDRLVLENDLLRRQILEKETSIFRDQVALLKEAGVSEDEIRQFIWSRLGQPLARLGRHQDTKLIEGPINDERPPRQA